MSSANMHKMKRPKPCLRCGSVEIFWNDCGYSSFNCGTAKCGKCGHEIKLKCLGCFPESEIRSAWNNQKKYAVKRYAELKKELNELGKLLGERP